MILTRNLDDEVVCNFLSGGGGGGGGGNLLAEVENMAALQPFALGDLGECSPRKFW